MRKIVAAAMFAAALGAQEPARAEGSVVDVTDMQALRTAVRADRKALVASTLALTPAEAKRFWPIYDSYQRVADAANRRRSVAIEALVALDKPITDLYAKNLASDLVGADEDEVRARRAMSSRLMRGVPTRVMAPKKAARYLQLESKIRAMQAYDIAAGIPLVK
jgi:hypothetical protein